MNTNAFKSVPRSTLLATFAAIIGGVLWFTGIPLAIVSFNHNNAMPYSFWNHVISELGFPYASHLTWLFNGTLTIGSLLLLPTIYALGAYLHTRLGYVAVGFSFVACLSLSGVGLYGLKQDLLHAPYFFRPFYRIHMTLAGAFGLGWLVSMTLFAIIFCRRWKDPASRLMAVIGIIFCLAYPSFLIVGIYPNPTQEALLKDLHNPAFRTILNSPTSSPILTQWLDSHRPPIFWQAAFEWLWAWSVLLWCGMALVFLWIKTRGSAKHSKIIAERIGHEIVA
jgi:hypothetical protein